MKIVVQTKAYNTNTGQSVIGSGEFKNKMELNKFVGKLVDAVAENPELKQTLLIFKVER